MNIAIHGVAQYYFTLTAEHLALLRRMAEMHYDFTCREQAAHADGKGRVNGPITIWERALTYKDRWPNLKDQNPLHQADFRTLDLMMKIMEYPPHDLTEAEIHLVCEMRRSFRGAMKLFQQLYTKWSTEYVDDFKPGP